MMNSILSIWADWWRVCPHCHSLRKGPNRWLCQLCEKTLAVSRVPESIATYGCYPFPLITLYHWRADRDEAVMSSWLTSFKGGIPQKQARMLAERLCFKAHRLGHLQAGELEGVHVVPAPLSEKRRKRGERNHAADLAGAVAEILSLPLWDGLERPDAQDQKSLRVSKRRETLLRPRRDLPPEAKGWLFVDDIVTSGSTAQAAHQALKKPAKYEVWALSDRSRLPA